MPGHRTLLVAVLLLIPQTTRASGGPATAFVLNGKCSDLAFPRKARQARTRLSRNEPFSTDLCPSHLAVRAIAGAAWKNLNYNGKGTDGAGMRACVGRATALSAIPEDVGVGLWTVAPTWYNRTATCIPKALLASYRVSPST